MSDRILLVEDEELLRRSIKFNLEQSGYRIITMSSAEDALDTIRRDPPDLVLLDIGLPGMDGLEAIREIRKIGDLPVIFLTARRRERLNQALDEIFRRFGRGALVRGVEAPLERAGLSFQIKRGEEEPEE